MKVLCKKILSAAAIAILFAAFNPAFSRDKSEARAEKKTSKEGSKTNKQAAKNRKKNGVKEKTSKMQITDWMNRGIGQVSMPEWLVPLVLTNKASHFLIEMEKPKDMKVIWQCINDEDKDAAKLRARLGVAQKAANELRKAVDDAAREKGVSEKDRELISETGFAIKVEYSGEEFLGEFWQEVKRDSKISYDYYYIVGFDKNTWSKISSAYTLSIVKELQAQSKAEAAKTLGENSQAVISASMPSAESKGEQVLAELYVQNAVAQAQKNAGANFSYEQRKELSQKFAQEYAAQNGVSLASLDVDKIVSAGIQATKNDADWMQALMNAAEGMSNFD